MRNKKFYLLSSITVQFLNVQGRVEETGRRRYIVKPSFNEVNRTKVLKKNVNEVISTGPKKKDTRRKVVTIKSGFGTMVYVTDNNKFTEADFEIK